MPKTVVIQVNEKTFKLGYGLEVFMNLGELWGLDTLEEVNEKFQILLNPTEGKTSLSNMKMMSEIVEAMIAGHPDNKETLSAREIRCMDMAQFETVMVQLVNGFAANMPQPQVEEAPEYYESEEESEKKPKARVKSKNP